MAKKKIARDLKQYSISDLVDAIVEKSVDDETGNEKFIIKCPKCGEVISNRHVVDYGYTEGDRGAWFIRNCFCNTPCRTFSSLKIGKREVWSNRKPMPKKNLKVKNVVKKGSNAVDKEAKSQVVISKPVQLETPKVKVVVKPKIKTKLGTNWWEK